MKTRTKKLWLGCAVALSIGASPPTSTPQPSRLGPGQRVRGEVEVAPDPAAGARDFALFCETCHGEAGDGDGLLASTLTPAPARLSDPALLSRRSDAALFQIIDEGGEAVGRSAGMAAWGRTLSAERIANLVAYIRQLQGARAPQGGEPAPAGPTPTRRP